MRRRMRALALMAASAAVCLPAGAHAQRSAYGINWSCGYEEGEIFVKRLKRASQDDLSCLAGAGLWDEALPRIGGRMDNERQSLRRLLDLVINDDETAYEFFEEQAAQGQDEAILWLLIARGDKGLQSSTVRSRNVAVNLFISLPPWVRERHSSDLADALLAEGDNRAALTLATALKAVADDPNELAKAALIRARVIERYGTTDEAVALYEEAISLGTDRIQAEAELRKIALMWRTGYLKTDEAVIVLRELVTIWRGERLGAGILLALARAYYFDQQLPQSLRLLSSIYGSNAPADIRDEAERRIRSIAEDLFVIRTVPSTIGDLMDVYELVRPVVGPREQFWLGDLRLAELLVNQGLIAGGEKLIRGVAPPDLKREGGNAALLSAARLMLRLEDRREARRYLFAIPRQELTEDEASEYARLEAFSAEIEDLKPILERGAARDVIRIVAQRAWDAEVYGLYAEARRIADDGQSWKEPTAEYLATGRRVELIGLLSNPDPRLKALSAAPKPSVYHADDLRPLLEPSAEVVDLAVTLTRIGQELDRASATRPGAQRDE